MKYYLELYRQQFRVTFASMFQYRAALLIWMIWQVSEPLVLLIVWSVVANVSGGNVGGYSASGFAAYYVMFMIVNQLTYTWIMYEFEYRIREGGLSARLLKPVHPIHSDIADNISSKLITFPVILVIATGLAFAFHASFSFTPLMLLLSVPAIFFAFLLRFLLEWTLSLAAFWTTRVGAVNQTYFMFILLFSGQLAPLTLMPSAIQFVGQILPFYWMIGFPVRLLLGQLSTGEALAGIGVQIIWVALALGLVRLVWRSGVKIYSAVGA
ncbi:MAG: ABC-2 family transporter protein [Dehalogenimonas sp.]